VSLCCPLSPAVASALSIEVIPQEVFAGDVFLLKVERAESPAPKAVFRGNQTPLSSHGEGTHIALVPVEVSTPPGDYPVVLTDGDREQAVTVHVLTKEFRTIHLTLAEEKVTLSPENQKRVEREYLLQKRIWDRSTDLAWKGSFIEPTGTEVSTEFGVKRIMNKKKNSLHRGMDFRGQTGTPVKAINSGTVVLSEDLFYGGNTLIIDHGMGLYSVYMHLSKFSVQKGDHVSGEQVIGLIGSSGRATGPHLHLSVKLSGVSVNPESLFKLQL
jgi:murein DD-endopeptidase MepM/ murein hydrolase activator NlpD